MDSNQRNWWLYILKLEHGKWYVGITSKSVEERLQEHRFGVRGAYWTMAHKPIGIEIKDDLGFVSKEHAEDYENKITRKLMKERGLNNVRGGDLRETGEYIKRFGYVYLKKDWEIITVFFLLLTTNFYLLIDKFFF